MRAFFFLLLFPLAVVAQQSMQTSFPDDAKLLAAEDLKLAVSEKTFTYKVTDGWTGRYDFKGEYFYGTLGAVKASGTWRPEGSSICFTMKRSAPDGCAEIRSVGNVLYLKRVTTGEVVRLEPN